MGYDGEMRLRKNGDTALVAKLWPANGARFSDVKSMHPHLLLARLHYRAAVGRVDCSNGIPRRQFAEHVSIGGEPLESLAAEKSKASLRYNQPPLAKDVEKGRELFPVFDDIQSCGSEEVGIATCIGDLAWAGSNIVDRER